MSALPGVRGRSAAANAFPCPPAEPGEVFRRFAETLGRCEAALMPPQGGRDTHCAAPAAARRGAGRVRSAMGSLIPAPRPWTGAGGTAPLRPVPLHRPRGSETKDMPLAAGALLAVAGSEAGTFEGYASLFGVVDLGRDMVMPGAFARQPGAPRRGGRPAALAARSCPALGVWQTIAEDGRGLLRAPGGWTRRWPGRARCRADAPGRGRRPVHRLPDRNGPHRAAHRRAPAGEGRSLGDLARHLPAASRGARAAVKASLRRPIRARRTTCARRRRAAGSSCRRARAARSFVHDPKEMP